MKRLILTSCVATLFVMFMLPGSTLASDGTGLGGHAPEPDKASAAGLEKASEARQAGKPPGHTDGRGRPGHSHQPGRPEHARQDGKAEHDGQGNRPAHSYNKGRPEHSHQPGRPGHARQGGSQGQPQQKGRP